MTPTHYCLGSEGNSTFLRAVADALDDELGPYFETQSWQEDSTFPRRVPQLFQDESVRNFGLIEVAGTITIFIASCFGKKIFDEVYDRSVKRPIAAFLDKIFNAGAAFDRKTIELRDVVYLEDINLVVLVRTRVNAENTKAVASLFLSAHKVAYAYIEKHGRKAPVHCHTIENGMVSIEPEFYQSIEQHNEARRPKWPPGTEA